MMKIKIFGILFLFSIAAVACNDFTDEVPGAEGENLYGTRAIGADPTLYYWYHGEKIYLTPDKSSVNVIMDDEFLKSSELNLLLQKSDVEVDNIGQSGEVVKLKFNSEPATNLMYTNRINSMKEGGKIKYVLPYFERGGNAKSVGTSDIFYLKLKKSEDIALLEKMATQYGMQAIEEVPYTPLWHILSIKGSDFRNSIDASNHFYETGYFEDVDPAFIFDFKTDYTNDPMFGQLWGLKNTSYLGFDINVVNAWNITRGVGVTVAILDQGIDPNHNDLSANFHHLSFDAQSGTSPSVFTGNSHGTHVAGTIAAIGNNNLQVVGVAHQSKIMRVSHDLRTSSRISSELASGINWAWQNGADIISNSWGDQGGAAHNALYSSILENAITDAMRLGRATKGSVVVFAAGNYGRNGAVMDYPGNFHDDILTVGSIEMNGSRSIFNSIQASGYGEKLDVVAPGSDILSTMPYNSIGINSGTSMAAPHVSGIAALVLSVNRDLTGKMVRDVIEHSAQKLPGYTFTTSKPNGTWNNQVGYGLADAYKAILKTKPAIDFTITNKSSYDLDGIYIGLTGKVGTSYTILISHDPGWVFAGQAVNGFPSYPGNGLTATSGTAITNLEVELYAATSQSKFVKIKASIDNQAVVYTDFNFSGGNTVIIPLPNSSVPAIPNRRILNIIVENQY